MLPMPANERPVLTATADSDAQAVKERLPSARYLLIKVDCLDQATLEGWVGELATATRQGGIPCYVDAAHWEIDRFTQRMFDLQSMC